ncbi:MAG TPA: MFS transporter [Candidatus Bipolaricaulota bacterium]
MDQRKALGVLFLTVFIDLLGFGIIIPLLPFYAERFGAPAYQVTLLMAIYSLFQFLTAPLWGRLSDRLGRRPILLLSLLGLGASYVWFGLATSLWMLFVVRALAGAMAGNIAAAQAYIADVTTPENRARGMGLIGAAFGLGFVIGPALGGILAGSDPVQLNVQLPAFTAAGLSFLALALALGFLPESLTPQLRQQPRQRVGRLAQLTQTLRQPQLAGLFWLFFLQTFAFAGMEATFALWSERRWSWGPQQNGYLFAYVGVLGAFIQGGGIGLLSKRFGERRLLRQGAVCLTIGFLVMLAVRDVPLLVVAVTWMAYGLSVMTPSLNSLVSQRAAPDQQGITLGMNQSAASLARILGPAWAGAGFSLLGIDWPFWSGAAVMLGALALIHRRLNTT